ncbi:MAG: hypothetical protein Ct9H300mP12_02180 [Acidimicrobiales bacterium]|nr:MAG: hypothetical protein Ct9H300mP12_02180 [Acidimicrobiales bacterium]
MSKTRAAWAGLLEVLAEAGERFAGEDWMVVDDRDVAEAHRTIAHILQSGLVSHAEFDPERPVWRRIVTPTRKFSGDKPMPSTLRPRFGATAPTGSLAT